jgi:hypothetical protein
MPITLKKAAEILDLNLKEAGSKMPRDTRDALLLAINSLKTVQFVRGGGEWSFTALFPGEAPEENPN